MDDADPDTGLSWDRNRERRERLWATSGRAPAAAPAAPAPPAGLARDHGDAREIRRAEHQLRDRQRAEDDATLAAHPRPRTRADCQDGPRPCPHVSCRHHVYLDINPDTGLMKVRAGEPWELEHSCSLDVAERGGMTLEEVGAVLGVTRERVRQLEALGLKGLRRARRRLT